MIGFGVYGVMLSRMAGGPRRLWQWLYLSIIAVFAFVYGLEVGAWAMIDWTLGVLVALSLPFIKTVPQPEP